MRIIGGRVRGRRLITPKAMPGKDPIRPTSDRAREALFNIIGHSVQEAHVLDLFAGTGAFGLESLSRGAASAVFVDNLQASLALIKKNIEICGLLDGSVVVRRDLTKGLLFLEDLALPKGFDLVFFDPPYGKNMGARVLSELGNSSFLHQDCIVIAEENAEEKLPEQAGALGLFDRRKYGGTGFWFYRIQV